MNRHQHIPEDFPESLAHLVDDPGPHPEIVYRRQHAQGQLTASVHGSHVNVPVSLRRRWALLVDLLRDPELHELLARYLLSSDFWVRVCVTAAAAYIAFEFLPIFYWALGGGQ